MAGYREFITGEVLTAGNVNSFLMEQATMTFADDAARAAALSGVLREGLLTYNLDTQRLEVYDGTDWVEPAPEPPAGIGPNVVQTVKTDQFTTTSSSLTGLTGLTGITITPSSATSKVLVIATINGATSDTSGAGDSGFSVLRGTTPIYLGTSGSAAQLSGALSARNLGTTSFHLNSTAVVLDEPGTTDPVIYNINVVASAGTLFINRNPDGTLGTPSSVTLVEVAA